MSWGVRSPEPQSQASKQGVDMGFRGWEGMTPEEPDCLVSSADQLQQLLTPTPALARPTSSTPCPQNPSRHPRLQTQSQSLGAIHDWPGPPAEAEQLLAPSCPRDHPCEEPACIEESVCIFCGCRNRLLQTWWLETRGIYSLISRRCHG